MSYIWANEFTDSMINTIKERVRKAYKRNKQEANRSREDKTVRVILNRIGIRLANDMCDECLGKEEE